MKKIIILLAIITPLSLSSCKWLKKKGWIGKKDNLKEQIAQLENKVKQDSIKYASELDKMKKESQSIIDSMKNNCSVKSSNMAYHVIAGSFRNPQYATDFVGELSKLGYKAEIVVAPNGFNLVSVISGNSINEVATALSNVQNTVNGESWIYVKQ